MSRTAHPQVMEMTGEGTGPTNESCAGRLEAVPQPSKSGVSVHTVHLVHF